MKLYDPVGEEEEWAIFAENNRKGLENLVLQAQHQIDLNNAAIADINNQIAILEVTAHQDFEPFQSTPASSGASSFGGDSSPGSSANQTAAEAEKLTEELVDNWERRSKVLDDITSQLEAYSEQAEGYEAKNSLIDQLISVDQNRLSDLGKVKTMYEGMADSFLSKIPASLRDIAEDGSISISKFLGEGNDEINSAISSYQEWADKAAAVNQEMIELSQTLKDFQVEKFNNIIETFDQLSELITSSTNKIDGIISFTEANNGKAGVSAYEELINQTALQVELLQKKRDELTTQMTEALKSGIEQGSDEWNEMYQSVQTVDSEILSSLTSIEEFQDAIQQLHWDTLDDIATQFGSIDSEISNLYDLLDTEEVTIDGLGTEWTDEAITAMGLLAQQYELGRYQAAMYGDEIEQLNDDYKAGAYSAVEYYAKLTELKDAQWESVNAYTAAEEAILDLNKTRVDENVSAIEDEIDAYGELIKTQKEQLDAEKDAENWRKTLEDKKGTLLTAQRQLNALGQGGDDPNTLKERLTLQEEVDEASKELTETLYDHNVETQKEALDQQLEDYTAEKELEIEKLEQSLDKTEWLLAESLQTVKEHSAIILGEISVLAAEHGILLDSAIVKPWKDGKTAISNYGTELTVQSSSFIAALQGIQTEQAKTQELANIASAALLQSFNTTSPVLLDTISRVNTGLINSKTEADNLRTHIADTLRNSYDTSGAVNSVLSVKNAANDAKGALGTLESSISNLGGQVGGLKNQINSLPKIPEYKVPSFASSGLGSFLGGLAGGALGSLLGAISPFAKGGVVGDDTNFLAPLAKQLGEDQFVAVRNGERILTPKQNQVFEQLIEYPFLGRLSTGTALHSVKGSGQFVIENVDNSIVVQGQVDQSTLKKIEALQAKQNENFAKIFSKTLIKQGARINTFDKPF